jgi:flavin reductase (DIM6/NTAB) family NADH-FMN oxidoreductase RutF
MKTFYTHDEIKQRWPEIVPGIEEPSHRHFHFRPARPANILVTRDPETNELNVSAGTIGPLTWDPYTIVVHCARSSLDSVHNIQNVGAPCVIALPGTDIITETWITALSVPRGVNEAVVAHLTLVPSRLIDVPSIAECPVNFECRIEWYREQHSHYIAGVRVLGASIDDRAAAMSQEEAMRWYPTWEVDDVENAWGGDVERLGILGEFLSTPAVRPQRGWGAPAIAWLADLHAAGELDEAAYATAERWLAEWEDLAPLRSARWQVEENKIEAQEASERREALQARITRLFEFVAWEEYDALRALLSEA